MAHEASNPLTAARAGLQLAMEAVGRWTDVAADRRLELLDELGQVVEDIDRAITFLRAIQDRARGALARSERFDVVRVVRSCITLESRVLKDRRVSLELDAARRRIARTGPRSEEHTSELQSPDHIVCRPLLEKKKQK